MKGNDERIDPERMYEITEIAEGNPWNSKVLRQSIIGTIIQAHSKPPWEWWTVDSGPTKFMTLLKFTLDPEAVTLRPLTLKEQEKYAPTKKSRSTG